MRSIAEGQEKVRSRSIGEGQEKVRSRSIGEEQEKVRSRRSIQNGKRRLGVGVQ